MDATGACILHVTYSYSNSEVKSFPSAMFMQVVIFTLSNRADAATLDVN